MVSYLSMRFYLFILLTCFNFLWLFFQDNCWFTMGWLKHLLPSVMHSFLCWPSKSYTEGLNMESTSPGFTDLQLLHKTLPLIHLLVLLGWNLVVYFPYSLHICCPQFSHVLTWPSEPTCCRWLESPIQCFVTFNSRVQPQKDSGSELTKTHIYKQTGLSASWILHCLFHAFFFKEGCM